MSGSTRAFGSVLGAGIVGTTASVATGSHHWLIVTSGISIALGGVAYVMSLIARHYR